MERLTNLDCFSHFNSIMCYVSFGSEIFTHDYIINWIESGKQVSVPCVVKNADNKRLMHAVKISDFNELSAGNYGIMEPQLITSNIVRPDLIDIVIVPGSVFDVSKNRLGYGGGYYDVFLKKTSKNCKKIGVCFDFQVLDNIPHEQFDIPVDILVTESRIIF